jgi:osmotically-inducible protein OsmY
MNASLVERIRLEVQRRLGAGDRIDNSDIDVRVEAGSIVLDGSVDDAFDKSTAEAAAREVAGAERVRSRIAVRDDIGAEGGPKETEFGTEERARGTMTSIPRP